MQPDDEHWRQWFEAAWTEREEGVYVRDFESVGLGIYPLEPKAFHRLGQEEVDPRWLTTGVFECPPSLTREHWVYVTSGLTEHAYGRAHGAEALNAKLLAHGASPVIDV